MNEYGSCQPSEPAEHRPASNFVFGHEDHGSECSEQQNVQIAEMIADEQAAYGNRADCLHVQVEDTRELPRTPLKPTRFHFLRWPGAGEPGAHEIVQPYEDK